MFSKLAINGSLLPNSDTYFNLTVPFASDIVVTLRSVEKSEFYYMYDSTLNTCFAVAIKYLEKYTVMDQILCLTEGQIYI